MGPVATVARATPFVRVQMRGVTDFAEAGELLSGAGLKLVEAASGVLEPTDAHLRVSDGLGELQRIDSALAGGIDALRAADTKVRALDGYRLVGPIAAARADFRSRLPRVMGRALSARDGLDALIDMLGGSGPRRFLVLSQNPDEVRPTGGYFGTYGLLETRNGHPAFDRYADMNSWYPSRPQAALPPGDAALPLRLDSPPVPQTLANANATADFQAAAQLAAQLWVRGGEQPVDGVIAMTPDVMARVLRVLGPVVVPEYGETVNANNVLERVDFHTHLEASAYANASTRKAFLVDLVHVVVEHILDAPASSWDPLGQAMAAGFDAREAMAWSNRPVISNAITERSWDGTLPLTAGDFFYDGEFEYTAKNGRGLRRTFEHDVLLHSDGSARITTKVTITNTLPPNNGGMLNLDSLSFVTAYGPTGATLDPATGQPDAEGPPIADHPSASWFRSADPLASTSFTVTWDVRHLLAIDGGRSTTYGLRFLPLPAHTGDTLLLHVTAPTGWRWQHDAPPSTVVLDHEFNGAWRLVRAS
jgi:hypothetical protein